MSETQGWSALFIDFENLHISAQNALHQRLNWYAIHRLLQQRYAPLAIRRVYAYWPRFESFIGLFLRLGYEPILTPTYYRDKPTDTRMIIDVITLGQAPGIQTVILGTGDSDFVDVVHILRRQGKRVIGLGIQETTSSYLITALDDFIAYETQIQTQIQTQQSDLQDTVRRYLNILSQSRVRLHPSRHRVRYALFMHQALTRQGPIEYSRVIEQLQARAQKEGVPEAVITGLGHQVFRSYALEFLRDTTQTNGKRRLWDQPTRLREPLDRDPMAFLNWIDLWTVWRWVTSLGAEAMDPKAVSYILYGDSDRAALVQRAKHFIRVARQIEKWPPDDPKALLAALGTPGVPSSALKGSMV
ncbi:MAG: NYN domain-containing protein [Chloroflexi bacterium]|nr:NYN domain-containing protein [Chloroflexota bacterium]